MRCGPDASFELVGGEAGAVVRWDPHGSAVTELRAPHKLREETQIGTAMRSDVIAGGGSRPRIHIRAAADADMSPVPQDRSTCSPPSPVTPSVGSVRQ